MTRSAHKIKTWLPIAILVMAIVIFFSAGLHEQLTLEVYAKNSEALSLWIAANGLLAWLALIGLYAVVTALSLPFGLYLTILSGAILGPWLAASGIVLGATLGAIALFQAIRLAFFATFEAKFKPYIARFVEGFRAHPFSYMLTLRLIPVAPFSLVNIVPALIGVSLRDYSLGTLIGIIPGTLAYAFVGAGFRATLESQINSFLACQAEGLQDCSIQIDLKSLIEPELLIGLGALAALSLLPFIIRLFKRGRA